MPFSRRRLLAGSLAAAAVLAACGEPDLAELPGGFASDADPTPPPALAVEAAVKPAGNVAVTVGVASGHAKFADFEILIHSAVADIMELSLGLTEYESGVVASSLGDARDFIHPLSGQILAVLNCEVEIPIVAANADHEAVAIAAAEIIDNLLAAS
jgi:hypothetical protein